MSTDIYKVAGVLIKERKLLIVRTKGKETFYAPGGKPKEDESPTAALSRELFEEIGIRIREDRLEIMGSYTAQAADQEDKTLKMDVYIIHSWMGSIKPSNEIEELEWVDSKTAEKVKIGSIFKHEVIPKLVEHKLID